MGYTVAGDGVRSVWCRRTEWEKCRTWIELHTSLHGVVFLLVKTASGWGRQMVTHCSDQERLD